MNWTNKVCSLFLFSLLFMETNPLFSQGISIKVIKKPCFYNNKYDGFKLIIKDSSDVIKLESGLEYWLDDFIKQPDSIKLIIIGGLLSYESDTSLCCMDVITRSFNGIEGCGGKPKDVLRYSVQIDALYMINRLCWPQWMEIYSCVPVLYDTVQEQSINNDNIKVRCVFKQYKKWYEACKEIGRIPKYFPFNDGRYVWYGGRKSGVSRDY